MNKMKKRNEDKKYKKITKGKFEDFKQIDQQQSTGSDSVTNQPTEREFFSPISSPTHEEIEKEPKKVEINQKIESVVKDSKKKQDVNNFLKN